MRKVSPRMKRTSEPEAAWTELEGPMTMAWQTETRKICILTQRGRREQNEHQQHSSATLTRKRRKGCVAKNEEKIRARSSRNRNRAGRTDGDGLKKQTARGRDR